MPGELEKGFNVSNEPNRSELRTAYRTAANREPETSRKSAPPKNREPHFEVQFELRTPATHYDI